MAMDSVDLADSVDDLADSVDPSDLADCVVVGCACDALHGVQRAALVFLAGGSMAMDSVDLADSVDLSDLADSVDPSDLADDCVACDALIFASLSLSSASLAALAYPALVALLGDFTAAIFLGLRVPSK